MAVPKRQDHAVARSFGRIGTETKAEFLCGEIGSLNGAAKKRLFAAPSG